MWLVATVGVIPLMIILSTFGTHKVQDADRYTNTTHCGMKISEGPKAVSKARYNMAHVCAI